MGKTKAKSRSEIEFLRGKIKHLEKKLKQFEKEGAPDEDDRGPEAEGNDEVCEVCGKGRIKIVDLRFVIYKVCNLCPFREKMKLETKKS